MDIMDAMDKNGLLNGQWTMDRNGHHGRDGQEWTTEWTMDNGQEWTWRGLIARNPHGLYTDGTRTLHGRQISRIGRIGTIFCAVGA